MEELYYNLITFLGNMGPLLKGLIVGLLFMLVLICARNIVKSHVNPKKGIFKLGQFLLLAILIAITVFVCKHVF